MDINIGHENYAQFKFDVYVSTDATADADSCSKICSLLIDIRKERTENLNSY